MIFFPSSNADRSARAVPSRSRTLLSHAYWVCVVAAGMAACSPRSGFGQDAATGTARQEKPVTVAHVDGSIRGGLVRALTDEFVTLDSRQIPIADLVSIDISWQRPIGARGGAVVQLANGDRLLVDPERIDDDNFSGTWRHFPRWPGAVIPLEAVRSAAFARPSESAGSRELLMLLCEQIDGADLLILNNGDRMTGELAGLGDDRFAMQTAAGRREIVRADVRLIAFDPQLASFPKGAPRRALLTLVDGSRLTVGGLKLLDGARLAFTPSFGGEMVVPLSAVTSLRVLGGRAVYLSDLEPADFQHTPYLSVNWPLGKDQSVTGGPLQLRGAEYTKGLGMHSKSRATYDLGGEYRLFQAVIGVDDSARGGGSVTFAVDIDGRRAFTSAVLTGKSPPESIGPLDVSNAQSLSLMVDFADFGDIQDHADWCDPLLIK